MLKKYGLEDVPSLFELMSHPEVFPYVRYKAHSLDDCYFTAQELISKEAEGELIMRTILNSNHEAIGTINLYDLQDGAGFLNTWIGRPYFGQGHSQISKELFFDEIFYQTDIHTIYLKIRKTNIRSIRSTIKLPYASEANLSHINVYHMINLEDEIFDLFVVEKDAYIQYRETNSSVISS